MIFKIVPTTADTLNELCIMCREQAILIKDLIGVSLVVFLMFERYLPESIKY